MKQFVKEVADQGLAVNSILVTKSGETQGHFFCNDQLTSIRSISKVLSCLGVYHAIRCGMFDVNTKILPFFPEIKISSPTNRERLEKLTIEHLLTLRMGHEKGLLFSKDVAALPFGTNLMEYIFNYPMPFNPGEFFVYNNAATYILSAIIQKLTGNNFSKWVEETIFKPLDISEYKWENSAQGVCLGASGLWLKNRDLHKVALLLLNNGNYNGKEVISSEWISNMLTPHVYVAELPEYASKQDRCINKVAYGFHIWLCGDKTEKHPKTRYFCDGTDGQFLIVDPDLQLTITILSAQKNMSLLYPVIGGILSRMGG